MNYSVGKFDANEWFIIGLLSLYVVVYFLPKRFPSAVSLVFILYGIAVGRFWDQVLGTPSMNFFDVNDSPKIDLFDVLLYISYGASSYLMVYFFDRFKFKKQQLVFYIPIWSLVSMGFEWLGDKLGVFHYMNGYQIIYSYPIYLVSYSILFILYYKLYKHKADSK